MCVPTYDMAHPAIDVTVEMVPMPLHQRGTVLV